MRTHAIHRVLLMTVGMTLLVGVTPQVVHASGGGGCGRAGTDDDGTKVSIRNFCFGPTILRVPEGGTRAERTAAMTQALADAFASGIAEHPQDWHMLQPLWLADLEPRETSPDGPGTPGTEKV